jgi:hypothetical protein
MTDARFPERWLLDRRFGRLSADAFRGFVLSLTWCVSNRTDGRIEAADLSLLPWCPPFVVEELVAAGLWTAEAGGWLVSDFPHTQTTRAQLDGLDHKRALTRERVSRHREKVRGGDNSGDGYGSRDVTGAVTRYTKDRLGQARQGQALEEEHTGILPESSKVPEPSSMDSVFCHGCGQELDDWDSGTVAGHCLACSAGPDSGGMSDPAGDDQPADGPGGCSVPGCSGLVTEYLRREYGRPVCFVHAKAVAS